MDNSNQADTTMPEHLNSIYENAPCGYHSLDAQGMYLEVNATELDWLQYSREELVGKLRFTDVIAPESIATFQSTFPIFMQTGVVNELHFLMRRRDGTTFPVLLSSTALKDSSTSL